MTRPGFGAFSSAVARAGNWVPSVQITFDLGATLQRGGAHTGRAQNKYIQSGGTDGGTFRKPTEGIECWRGLQPDLQSPPGANFHSQTAPDCPETRSPSRRSGFFFAPRQIGA